MQMNAGRRVFRKGSSGSLFAAIASVCALGAIFYFIFELLPYYAIFLSVNFFFLYVELVYILKFKEDHEVKTTGKRPFVTVLVPIYNSAKTLEESLRAIKALKYDGKIEIIAIEDASTDDSYKILRKFRGIRIIRTRRNIGKAASLNLGIAKARGEMIATIDSDTFVHPDALTHLASHFTGKEIASVIGLVSVSRPRNLLQRIQEVEYYVGHGFTQISYGKLESIFITPGPLSMYRKSILFEVGGFDEDNITEDMDIALNIRKHSYRIITTTEARAFTSVPRTLMRLYKQRIRWFRGAIYNGKKYFSLWFNKAYGTFGRFVFPVSYLIQALSIVVIARLAQLYLTLLAGLFYVALAIAPESPAVAFGIISSFAFRFQSAAIFYITTLLIWGYVVYTSFSITKRRIGLSDLPPILLFMTVYPMFLSIIYFISFIKEVSSSELKW
ncbi:MAG: glycosyltransferase family 2 protein [Candidatus Micrarchaeota archaeon]